ncbi:UdgX family uracil-DNA binding protein [Microlunatus elymi]|uniref:Type-4 uracil-DNA glycosylase n=1 Tax=Microlunatus elymi TaxID=2596828 RepID=A0A516PV51_9ACTN|nr:UdgX family uracil-DNA binding protein [Microlunatus elymi]QDP95033.1 UdgX family uracil-DNA binding protein [Microlunatus elymi]
MTTHYPGAEDFLPQRQNLASLRSAVQDCRGCDLYATAIQAVFGEGLRRSRLIMIGEQPGDVEDHTGRPFTGPAGRLLDKALVQAGIERSEVFLTNAVKHFRFRTRGATGKRRIHQTPSQSQVNACRPWLEAELDVVKPEGAVVLGSVAGKSIFGPDFTVGSHRGTVGELPGRPIWSVSTIHPSAALRAENRAVLYEGLVADLELAARTLAS